MSPRFLRRWLLPPGYELLPVEVIETLADASERAYLPAFGGNQDAVKRAAHAARSARNVLARRRTGGRKP